MSWWTTLGRFWNLCVYPFLKDPQERGAVWRPMLMLGLTVGMTGASVVMTLWSRSFYDALEAKQYAEFFQLLGIWLGIACLYISIALYRLSVTRRLNIQWRSWAAETWTRSWLAERRFYHLELHREKTDNPDQRISEDLRGCIAQSLELLTGLIGNGLSLISFVGMLWAISGALEWSWGEWSISIPGYMVWIAIAYAIAGSWLAHRIGRPLNDLNFRAERAEADYRGSLFRLREHAESIALYGGEAAEHAQLRSRFQAIRELWELLTARRLRLLAFVTGYNQAAMIFPILIAAPQYFATAMTLGTLMQITSAFRSVNDALSWFVDHYAELSLWKASVERLLTFQDVLESPHQGRTQERLARHVCEESGLGSSEPLTVCLPSGEALLSLPSFSLTEGSRVLLSGPSGCGKSTLLRAFAGLWPYGTGTLKHPGADVLFLPQRPYLPHGTLAQVLSFPSQIEDFQAQELEEALRIAQLGHLIEQIPAEKNWSLVLSGGEQQRLGFARVFLQKPRWLFMDESTSALDEPTERQLFEALHAYLPECTVLTVAHRPALSVFHDAQWHVAPSQNGSEVRWGDALPQT
jgi:putative ATP-binding cassette transporter